MNSSTIEEVAIKKADMPGAQLAALRQQRGLSEEFVATSLNLRLNIIQLLEQDDYEHLPEPVFIKGYIRAYAKLLQADPEAILAVYGSLCVSNERQLDKALWQYRQSTPKAEHAVRWLTICFGIGVLIAVAIWWQKNRENEHLFPEHYSQQETTAAHQDNEIRLTDLSKMRSLLTAPPQYNNSESQDEHEG